MRPHGAPPRIYNLFPLLVGTPAQWSGELPRIQAMGFDWVFLNPFHYPGFSGSLYAVKDMHRLHPLLDDGRPVAVQLGGFLAEASRLGLKVMMDLVINHTSKDAILVTEHPEWFLRTAAGTLQSPHAVDPIDPTKITEWGDLAELNYEAPASRSALVDHWREVVRDYARLGFAGFRCDAAYKVPASVWAELIDEVKRDYPEAHFAAETLGCTPDQISALAQAGFDTLFNSAKWWDFHAPWLLEQYELLRGIAPSVAFPESHDTERLAAEWPEHTEARARMHALFAAFFSSGWMMTLGYEWGWRKKPDVVHSRPDPREEAAYDLSGFITALNRVKAETPALSREGPQHRLTPPEDDIVSLLRWTPDGTEAALLVMNTHPHRVMIDEPARRLADAGGEGGRFEEVTPGRPIEGRPIETKGVPERIVLQPLEARLWRTTLFRPPEEASMQDDSLALSSPAPLPDVQVPGILILDVQPVVDGGRYPVKREVGDHLEVSADILKEGHDHVAARVLWREKGEATWHETPMSLRDNDRWQGSVPLSANTRVFFTLEAWVDTYETWRGDTGKKQTAGQPLTVEATEGFLLVQEVLPRVQGMDRERLERVLADLSASSDAEDTVNALSSTLVRGILARWPDRTRVIRHERVYEVVVDRVQARFAAWYAVMARSQGTDPHRSGTFDDCIRRLPELARMGFDVLYLLPIHPIGRVHRKGPDNTLTANPGDPGSPYAIGSDEGGHTTLHPELGGVEDFRRLVAAARQHGMELALDFAIQCAPDHPWVRHHPEWFRWRPDGTIRYAENPPKKYQDIVNLEFHGENASALWQELLGVVQFWVREGVRIFRVDNPHTKPLPFWEWLIRTIHDEYPDVIFLSEAFTRPKLMRALAKIGFAQSYTYFTWRNFKTELVDYMRELSSGESREYLRPNFWPSTPDILPPFLQTGGRAAFRIRLVLAATLGSVYGLYNGYELCENEAIPGKEEYLHSEKYQFKVRDWDQPGNIKDEIARLNAIRRENPALQEFENVQFHPSSDDAVVFYGKSTLSRSNMIFVVVTLDPFDAREAEVTFPLSAMGIPAGETYEVEDLLSGQRHLWRGARQRVRLDPKIQPALIFRVTVWASVDYHTPCF